MGFGGPEFGFRFRLMLHEFGRVAEAGDGMQVAEFVERSGGPDVLPAWRHTSAPLCYGAILIAGWEQNTVPWFQGFD